MATNADRLVELRAELATVKAAIAKAITRGQSATSGDRSLTRARLDLLISERNQLERDIQRLELGGGRAMHMDFSGTPYATPNQTTGVPNG